jgi:uncharacterized protein YjbI with pentapeptide repeats
LRQKTLLTFDTESGQTKVGGGTANLAGADLSDANLTRTNLTGAILDGVPPKRKQHSQILNLTLMTTSNMLLSKMPLA